MRIHAANMNLDVIWMQLPYVPENQMVLIKEMHNSIKKKINSVSFK